MNRKQLLKYDEPLHAFMRMVRIVTFMGIILSMVLYGLALNSYFNHALYWAVLFASVGFVFFHFLRRYVVSITCYVFRRLGEHDEVVNFIEQSLDGKEQRAFFLLLDKALATIKK
jgi:hypothetical protein